jgi:hypothetical protein
LVLVPGLDPRWWSDAAEPHRDHFLQKLIDPPEDNEVTPSEIEIGLREAARAEISLAPDSVWVRVREIFPEGAGGLIVAGLSDRPPDSPRLCLWASAELREVGGLLGGLPEGDLIRPARVAEEIGQTAGLHRPLRTEEVREILALPPSGLDAFRALPADLPDHPLARLKRVFLGDKLLANTVIYAAATCRWSRAVLRLGLVEAFRAARGELHADAGEDPAADEFLLGLDASRTLVADRVDRILFSLWNEIPKGGAIWLVAGDDHSSWLFVAPRE